MIVRKKFPFCGLPDRTPTGGKSENTGILGRGRLKKNLEHPYSVFFGGRGLILGYFGPGRPLALRETLGAGQKRGKTHNFLVLGVPKQKKNVPTLSGMVVRNFLTFYVLPDQTPTGGKTQSVGFLGHSDLGGSLALAEIPGAGPKQKNIISRC